MIDAIEQKMTTLYQRVENIAESQVEMKSALKDIAASLKSLTRLEVEHNESRSAIKRAFTRIDDHETRVRDMEDAMPTIKLATGWIFKAVIGVLSILGFVAITVILRGVQ